MPGLDRALICGSVDLQIASPAKEVLQNSSTLILQDTGCDIAAVIEARHFQKVDHASRSAARWICATENHALDSCVHECTCAHRAWLLGDVNIAPRQPPVPYGCLSLCQHQHFGVRSSVFQ